MDEMQELYSLDGMTVGNVSINGYKQLNPDKTQTHTCAHTHTQT